MKVDWLSRKQLNLFGCRVYAIRNREGLQMRRKDTEKIFQMVCRAFPESSAAVFKQNGEILMRKETVPGFFERMKPDFGERAEQIEYEGRTHFYICYPLFRDFGLALLLDGRFYKDIEEPLQMLEVLAALWKPQEEQNGLKRKAEVEENPLLGSLLYADTLEMQIYTVLLAEEKGKSLELPRAVCIIRGQSRKMADMLQQVQNMRETDPEDIYGISGGENIVLCRHLSENGKSIRFQCEGYFEKLSGRIEEKCGFRPEIWVGTEACQIGEYRYSMEAALEAGECSRQKRKNEKIVYASDYLLECTMMHTNEDTLKHFLEPYAKKLKAETGLFDTAEALLENNMNISLAARRQFMHRNTMMLHASRLWSLLAIDPAHSDRDRFLLMMICFYCRKYA